MTFNLARKCRILRCSVCKNIGHNKRTCSSLICKNDTKSFVRKEVQLHGFLWEKEILSNVYGASKKELSKIKYNSKIDLPLELNRLEKCNISVKTTCNKNYVCMGDCLRFFDAVSDKKPLHVVVIHYKQNDDIKKVVSIIEMDLTNAKNSLFGCLSRSAIEFLDEIVKSVSSTRKPTSDEHKYMYFVKKNYKKFLTQLD